MPKKGIIYRIFSNIYVKNILLMLLVIVLFVVAVLLGLSIYTKHNESVSVPDVKGLQVDEAAGLLRANSLTYTVIDSVYLAEGKPGAITEQIPQAESNVKKGKNIYLTIQAKGKQMVTVPVLRDYSQRQAEAQLNALGFTNIIVSEVHSQYKGLVISVEYKGQEVRPEQKIPKGATLRLVVGDGGGRSESEDTESANVDKSFFE